jgi:hypothetical protein
MLVALLPALVFGYGEPAMGDDPSQEERLLHVLTNQVRQAPHDWPGWDTTLATGDPRSPLLLQGGLEEAARFHADDMAMHGFFSHDSSDGTSFANRIAHYFPGSAGENIYMASAGGAHEAMTAWMNSEGHRTNILDATWMYLGPGFSQKDGALYYVQDFGSAGTVVIPAIPGGALQKLAPGKLELFANFFDPMGREPKAFSATIGAMTIVLMRIAGPPGNETLSAPADEPTACERLTFSATDADGNTTVFPTTGALLAGAACTTSATGASTGTGPSGSGQVVIPADNPEHKGCACVSSEAAGVRACLLLIAFFLAIARRPVRRIG